MVGDEGLEPPTLPEAPKKRSPMTFEIRNLDIQILLERILY